MGRIDDLVALSRRYGSDPDWVLAGGGNTSFKDGERLWVKASGHALAAIDAGGFCEMDRSALAGIWGKDYPAETKARESAALADLMAARAPGEDKRPSVETLLHGFFPQAYVVHTHPAVVNGMTCGLAGEAAFRELFADDAIWVPYVDPGYVLARRVKELFEEFTARRGRPPALAFLQNHGLITAAGHPAEIDALSRRVVSVLRGRTVRLPDRSPRTVPAAALSDALAEFERLAPGACIAHRADPDILGFAAGASAFAPLAAPFSPDHIVYAGSEYLRVDDPSGLALLWEDFRRRAGRPPRIVLVAGLGAFSVMAPAGPSPAEAASAGKAASAAMALFLDACAVAVYSESFGGPSHMSPTQVDFILGWEVESYRAKASLGAGG